MVLQRFNFYLVFSHLWFLKWFLMELAFAFLAHFFFLSSLFLVILAYAKARSCEPLAFKNVKTCFCIYWAVSDRSVGNSWEANQKLSEKY